MIKSIKELIPTNLEEQKLLNLAIKKGIDIGVKIFIDEPKHIYIIDNLYFFTNYENDFSGRRELQAFLSKKGDAWSGFNVLSKRAKLVSNQISIHELN